MAREQSPEERASAARQKSVFLNLPYDRRFRNLFLAYMAGTSAFGLIPRATAEIIDTTRETVNRLFSKFKRKQLLQLKGPTLVIRNRKVLEKIAPRWDS